MAFGKKKTEEEPKQDVLVEAADPHAAIMAHLGSVRGLLSSTGHFEHNEAVKLIDQAIVLCEACEATDEP